MIERYKKLGIRDVMYAGLAALALVAASDTNPAYADSQCGHKAIAQYNDMVVLGVETVDPKIQQICPPERWNVIEKTVFPVSRCYERSRFSTILDCHNTGYYQFNIKCEEK